MNTPVTYIPISWVLTENKLVLLSEKINYTVLKSISHNEVLEMWLVRPA